MIYLKMMEMKNLPLDILRQPLEDRGGSSLPLRSRGLFPAKKQQMVLRFQPWEQFLEILSFYLGVSTFGQ